MKRLIYAISVFFVFACDSENANDCFQKVGAIVQQEFVVESFDKIFVDRDVHLVIKEGSPQRVVVEAGKNLMNEVSVSVVDGKLTLADNNTCNFVRDYGTTTVFVTSPNIKEIRSSTQYDVVSDGILTYPDLRIISEDFNKPSMFTIGNFRLQIDNSKFVAVFNGISNCYIKGKTNNLSISFFAGNSRFEGRGLEAQDVSVFSRSSNDIIVNPQQKITGKILGTGDVILVTKPPVVEVEQPYKGRLIFE